MTAHYDKWLEAHLEEVINLYQEYRADTGDEETKPSEFAEDLYKFLPGEAEGGSPVVDASLN